MVNRTTGEARHVQSIRPVLHLAAQQGWRCDAIEHEGIRQYRFTKAGHYTADGEHFIDSRTASAYFVDEADDGEPYWRFAIAFDHRNSDVPLRLHQLRDLLVS